MCTCTFSNENTCKTSNLWDSVMTESWFLVFALMQKRYSRQTWGWYFHSSTLGSSLYKDGNTGLLSMESKNKDKEKCFQMYLHYCGHSFIQCNTTFFHIISIICVFLRDCVSALCECMCTKFSTKVKDSEDIKNTLASCKMIKSAAIKPNVLVAS